MRHARLQWMPMALAFVFVWFFSLMAAGQQAAMVPARITQPVDLAKLVTLRGNTHPLARPEYDQGAAPDSQPMERILLVLQRSPEQEAALRKLLDEQQIKSSPNYHMWLTPQQFGQQFGPADADIQAVTDWLTSQGFQVSHVAAGRTVIEFSGTAGQVRQGFHTEIHRYVVKGEEHWANASDPQIPEALKPVVAGFASLNNFPKRPRVHRLGTFSKSKATGKVTPLFTYPSTLCPSGTCYAVGPTDFATIYNVSPLWSAGINGTGQTIAVSEQTNINIQDVADFRTMFGLPTISPQSNPLCSPGQVQSQVPVNLCLNGPDPGILFATGDESEADLDVQWAGAVAEGATVDLVVSETTEVTVGIDLSALYIIDNNLAPIMSESYGNCEAFTGASGNQFYYTLWEQGAAQGITILVAAGDSGSAGCDDPTIEDAAQYGLAAAGNGATPFNVAVGGTDFNDVSNPSQYWSSTNNSTTQSSAKSYIPEITWNDSCAQSGQTPCSTSVAPNGTDLTGGSGGPSNCAYGGISQVTELPECPAGPEGTAGWPKPSWQTGTGVPNDQVRDTPDVSLFAADGFISGSFYIYCEMDANASSGGSSSSCDLSAPYQDFQGAGGTSFAAPAFAGIIAMVNQKTSQSQGQGNANYVLYPLAATSGNSCASNSSAVGSTNCIFYDIQTGDNSVACMAGSPNCGSTGTNPYGILEVDGLSAYTGPPTNYAAATPAWPTSVRYDLATGLGTVNVANLVNNWTSVSFTPTTTTLSISPATFTHGTVVTVTGNVTSSSGTPTGDVSLIGGPSGGTLGIGPFTLSNGAIPANTTTTMLPGGTYGVTAHYAGDGIHGASDSTPPFQVTVNPESSQALVQVVSFTCTGLTYGVTTLLYGYSVPCSYPNGASILYSGYLLKVDVTNGSGSLNVNDVGGVAGACYSSTTGYPTYQCPTGQVTVTNNGGAITDLGAPSNNTPGTYTLNSQGYVEDQYIQLPGGTDVLSATYVPHPIAPNNSYNTSTGTTTITVTQAATATTLSGPTSASSGGSVTLTAVVGTVVNGAGSVGLAPSGTVQFLNNGTPITGTPTYTPVNGSAPNEASLYGPGQSPATNYASLTATLTTSFTVTSTTTESITAQYLGDGNYQQSPPSAAVLISISPGPPDFSLAASPSSLTITAPGQSATTTISGSAINNFTGTVNVTCALQSTMTYSSCSLVPTSFSVPGGSTVLTVTTTAPSVALRLFNRPGWFMPSTGALFASILLLLILGKRRRAKLAFGLLLFALLAAAFVACGGGSSSSAPSSPGTPTGNYTATVTGTSGTLSHSLNVPVTVQ